MKYFEVEIVEMTKLRVAVMAEDWEDAEMIAYHKWCDGEIDMGFGDIDAETETQEEIDEEDIEFYSHEVLKKDSDENEK